MVDRCNVQTLVVSQCKLVVDNLCLGGSETGTLMNHPGWIRGMLSPRHRVEVP